MQSRNKLFTAVKHRLGIKQLFDVSCHCPQSPAGNTVSLDFSINSNLMGDSGLTFPNVKEMWRVLGSTEAFFVEVCALWTGVVSPVACSVSSPHTLCAGRMLGCVRRSPAGRSGEVVLPISCHS